MRQTVLLVCVVIGICLIAFAAKAPAYSGPSGASAECKDGTYSYSLHSSGTCSWHGGVRAWNHTSIVNRIFHTHPALADDTCNDPNSGAADAC